MTQETINAMSVDWAQLASGAMPFKGGSAEIAATTVQRLQNERDLALHSPVMQFAEAHRDLASKYPAGFQPYFEKADELANAIQGITQAGSVARQGGDASEPHHGLSQNLAEHGPSSTRGA